MKKQTHSIRNWSEYNASLKKRGSLTISRQFRRDRQLDDR
jgi:hypothetical protein